MDEHTRVRVRERFGGRCGYCGVHEEDTGATLTVDHHRPRTHGGDDGIENLVYACPRCNEHKGSYWHEKHSPHVPLLHPGRDDLGAHVRDDDGGQVRSMTLEGAFFIERLRLNRPALVAYRQELRERRLLREELAKVTERARMLEEQVNELGIAIDVAADEIENDGR